MRAHTSWRVNALCLGLDPNTFYPAANDVAAIELAKSYCRECPVRSECLAEARANREPDGIFGGLTVEERKA